MYRVFWPALALLGAGLILLAVAAGTDAVVAVLLSILAVTQLGFGGAALRLGRLPAPRTLLGLCATLTIANLALVFGGEIGLVPFVALLLFQWGVAIAAGLELRRPVAHDTKPVGTGRLLGALASGAILVAAITTPALSLTEPGTVAVPHGVHDHH